MEWLSFLEQGTYFSTIDTSKIKLLTGYGDNYTMPRFFLPGTQNTGVFLSVHDYLDISSFITFTLSSDGALGSPSNELFITYPNGGQTFMNSDSLEILWSSFGNTNETLDLWYSTSDASDSTFDSTKYLPRNCTVTEGGLKLFQVLKILVLINGV